MRLKVKPAQVVSLRRRRLRCHDVLQNRRDGVRLVPEKELSHAYRLVSVHHLRLRVGGLILAQQVLVIRRVGKVAQSRDVWVGGDESRPVVVDLM